MGDGNCIRYKDLHALFEQILEKTMRLEQRDWRESPVRVWVNTFKVFLDEYMTEYMPSNCTALKVNWSYQIITLTSHWNKDHILFLYFKNLPLVTLLPLKALFCRKGICC